MRQTVDQSAATVSATSASRFAARSRSRRWLTLRWVVLALSLCAVLGGAWWVAYFSPLLTVRRVHVVGVTSLSPQQVLQSAQAPIGQPLARLDRDTIQARIRHIPQIDTAEVARQWPHTVRITIAEREAAAVVPRGDGYVVVDSDGVAFNTVKTAPSGVPVIYVSASLAPPETVRAGISVLRVLPASIARRVVVVSASSPDNVELKLDRGQTVRWGSFEQSDHKAKVLAALMKINRSAQVYDVSAPNAPATRGG